MPASFRKTRIAPTPSGFLHLGNAFSFLQTSVIASETGAKILLRIDDMDRERVDPRYVSDIFETLHFLGISWNEGPKDTNDFEMNFSQRSRLPLYEKMLADLVQTGLVYACDCSRKMIAEKHRGIYPGTCINRKIPLSAAGVCWRIDTSKAGHLEIKTLNGGSVSVRLPDEIQHFTIRKKDGFPAYQVTSLADDLHFEIDLIVRGEDLWPSTVAQIFLAGVLGERRFLETAFHHHPLVKDGSGQKLSKSDGATSISHLRRQGFSTDEVLQMIGSDAQNSFGL